MCDVGNDMVDWAGANIFRCKIISDLRQMVEERLQCFYDRNKRHPARVIVYRDGVSEGMCFTTATLLTITKPTHDQANINKSWIKSFPRSKQPSRPNASRAGASRPGASRPR